MAQVFFCRNQKGLLVKLDFGTKDFCVTIFLFFAFFIMSPEQVMSPGCTPTLSKQLGNCCFHIVRQN